MVPVSRGRVTRVRAPVSLPAPSKTENALLFRFATYPCAFFQRSAPFEEPVTESPSLALQRHQTARVRTLQSRLFAFGLPIVASAHAHARKTVRLSDVRLVSSIHAIRRTPSAHENARTTKATRRGRRRRRRADDDRDDDGASSDGETRAGNSRSSSRLFSFRVITFRLRVDLLTPFFPHLCRKRCCLQWLLLPCTLALLEFFLPLPPPPPPRFFRA